MRVRMNGGVVGPTNLTSTGSASGVFSVVEAQLDSQNGEWPSYVSSYTDPLFYKTKLLLHADGSMNANNNTIIDSYPGISLSRTGTTTQGSFSPYGQTGWSSFFNGSSNYLTVPNINFSTNAFTIEGWFLPFSLASGTNLWGSDNGSGSTPKLILYINGTSLILECGTLGGALISVTAATYLTAGLWHHIAVVRTGTGTNQTTLYVNGVAVGSGTLGSLSTITATFNIAYIGEAFGLPMGGYISNFRVVNGVAAYTGNFTVPTSPLSTTQSSGTNIAAISNPSSTVLLTCNSNRHVDRSPAAAVITSPDFYTSGPRTVPESPFAPQDSYGVSTVGGSISAITTSDAVTGTLGSSIGTSDFSIEYWLYPTSYPSTTNVCPVGLGAANILGSFSMFFSSATTTTTFRFGSGGSGSDYTIGSLPRLLSWTHYAICRSGGVTSVYVNGVLIANTSAAISGQPSISATSLNLFALSGLNQYLGYLAGLRIQSGVSAYSGAFTPPTAPVTSTGNTILLLNGTNGSIFDSSSKHNIVTGGTNVGGYLSTTQSKFGPSSIRLPGSVAMNTVAGPQNSLGIGNFTIEMWIWFDSMATQRPMGQGTLTTGEFLLIFNSDGSFDWCEATTSRVHGAAGVVTAGAWYHLAIVRSGLTTTAYVNGTSTGTPYTAVSNYNFNATTPIYLGAGGSGATGSQTFAGYIDDLRITVGAARYTANFTVPSAPFGNQ